MVIITSTVCMTTASGATRADAGSDITAVRARQRVLHFPKDQCLGRVKLWPETLHGELPVHPRRADLVEGLSDAPFVALAQGDVVVPEDRCVDLSIWGAGDLDLSCLSRFGPGDIYACSLGSRRLMPHAARRVLEPVKHLTGLRVLSISGTGIMEPALAVLCEMPSLRGLALNVTPGRGPAGLAGLPELPSLEWFDCDVGAVDTEVRHLATLANLTVLRLRLDRIRGPGLADLARLPRLEQLCLWGETGPTNQHVRYLEGLTQIKRLTLWGGPGMTNDALKSIGTLTGLEALTLIHVAGLTDDGAKFLEPLRRLRYVEFDGDFGDEAIRVMSALGHLEALVGLTIGPEGTRLLGPMTNLRTLELVFKGARRGGPADAGLHHLAALHALEKLEITGAQIRDGDLTSLESLSNLKDLTVHADSVTNAGMASICKLKRLESLTLYMVHVTKSGLNQLSGLSNLKSLVVKTHPQMTGGDDAMLDLSGLKHLEKLSLLNCNFSLQDADLAFLPFLTQLKWLNLAVVKSERPWGAGFLPGMKTLESRGLDVLRHEPLSSDALKYVRGLMELSYLRLPFMVCSAEEDFASLGDLRHLAQLRLEGRIPDTALRRLDHLPSSVALVNVQTTERISGKTLYYLRQNLPGLATLEIERMGRQGRPIHRPSQTMRR